jgi:hypothetical protein
MRLTIIPSDKSVVVDGQGRSDLDFSSITIPSDIHAIQWYGAHGFLEFVMDEEMNKPENQRITELPQWATDCKAAFDAAVALSNAPLTTEQIQFVNRSRRDGRLKNCDWTQVVDAPLTTEQKAAWSVYRQQLRDLPDDLVWLNTLQAPFPPAPTV